VVGVDADASVATLISARDDAGGLGPIDLPLGRRGRRVRRAGEFADPTRLVGVRCKDRQQATLGGRSQDRREGGCFGTHGGPLRGDCYRDRNTCTGKATFVKLSHHCEPCTSTRAHCGSGGCHGQRIPDARLTTADPPRRFTTAAAPWTWTVRDRQADDAYAQMLSASPRRLSPVSLR
jgi:hypothetical protein